MVPYVLVILLKKEVFIVFTRGFCSSDVSGVTVRFGLWLSWNKMIHTKSEPTLSTGKSFAKRKPAETVPGKNPRKFSARY